MTDEETAVSRKEFALIIADVADNLQKLSPEDICLATKTTQDILLKLDKTGRYVKR